VPLTGRAGSNPHSDTNDLPLAISGHLTGVTCAAYSPIPRCRGGRPSSGPSS